MHTQWWWCSPMLHDDAHSMMLLYSYTHYDVMMLILWYSPMLDDVHELWCSLDLHNDDDGAYSMIYRLDDIYDDAT